MLQKAGLRQSGRIQATSCLCPRGMVLGMDSATCVSSQQFDATTIQSVEAIIGAVQGEKTDEMRVKEPETETEEEELEQPKTDPDLEQAMEVLKEKQMR